MSDFLSRLGITDPQPTDSGAEHGAQTRPDREPLEILNVETKVPETPGSDLQSDYIAARNYVHTFLGMIGEAAYLALQTAKETEHPRAFEAFNALAVTQRQYVSQLLDMNKMDVLFDRYRTPKEESGQGGTAEGSTGSTQRLTPKLTTNDILNIARSQQNSVTEGTENESSEG